MSTHGHVTNITRNIQGDELVTNAAGGATVLQVVDVADFDEDGGTLLIGGNVCTYLTVDDEACTITLAAGLPTAAVIGDRVDVWDEETADVVVEYVADIVDETTNDAIQASVDHALADKLIAAVRGGAGESVVLEVDEDGDWAVSQVLGKTPVIHGVTFETDSEGQRMVMRPDESGGILESYSGVDGETPGAIDPSAYLGAPSMEIRPGATPTYDGVPTLRMFSQTHVSGDAYDGSIYLWARFLQLQAAGSLVVRGGDLIDIAGNDFVLIRSNVTWTPPGLAPGFTAVSGQEPAYLRDAAGTVHIQGAVVVGGARVSGDRVFTLPALYRPAQQQSSVVRRNTLGDVGLLVVATTGEVTLNWAGANPTAMGLETRFSIL